MSSQTIHAQNEKLGFDQLVIGKVMYGVWRATNAGNYNLRLRR